MSDSKGIGLAQLLGQVRAELEQARKNLRASGKDAMLDWESAEVEISFGVKKEAKGTAGVDFYIFAIEAGGGYKSEEVHRLTLRLKPHKKGDPSDGNDVVAIAGDTE